MKLARRLPLPEDPLPAVASGLLLVLCYPPLHLLVPPFIALVPYALWVARLPSGARGRRDALRGGYLMGLVYFGLLLYWLVVSLIFYTPLAVLAYLLPLLILSGFLALATAGVHAAYHRLGWPLWVALPVFWTATEWLRAHLGPVSFPWMEFGATLTGFPWLVGSADVLGTRGISFWLCVVNGLLASLLLPVLKEAPDRWRRWLPGARTAAPERPPGGGGEGRRPGPAPGRRALLLGLALVVAVPAAYSLYRWGTLDTRPSARVAVLQPNIPEDVKLEPAAAVDSTVASITRLYRRQLRPRSGGLDFVVMPEMTIPDYPLDPVEAWGYPGRPDLKRWMTELARGLEAPVLYGGHGTEETADGEVLHYNSAFLRSPEGERLAFYGKRRLVPVIERVPFVDPDRLAFLMSLGRYFGHFSIGPRDAPMALDGVSFGVLICYESIFSGLSRRYRQRGADFLVNMTNDAWYGREEPFWNRTTALWQHPAHMVMRALETRMGVVRAANTGISLMIDPLGGVSHRTPLFEPAAFTAEVRTSEGRTFYVRYGDLLGWAAALAAVGAALAAGIRRVRDGGTPPGDGSRAAPG